MIQSHGADNLDHLDYPLTATQLQAYRILPLLSVILFCLTLGTCAFGAYAQVPVTNIEQQRALILATIQNYKQELDLNRSVQQQPATSSAQRQQLKYRESFLVNNIATLQAQIASNK